jgi:SAM-dependent methyltransferase
MHEVDLAALSAAYRLRPIGRGGLARARVSIAGIEGIVLDVGGGPGDHAHEMRSVHRTPIVVDIEPAMCARASARGLDTVLASSEALPFTDGSAAMAYFHLSIHYGSWRTALDEARRVVAPGGRIEIWTFDRAGLEASSLARWFPSVARIDAERFPDPGRIAAHLTGGGAAVAVQSWPDPVEWIAREWEDAVRARYVSTLQLLDDDEIERGLAAFRAVHPDPSSRYRYSLRFLRISALV